MTERSCIDSLRAAKRFLHFHATAIIALLLGAAVACAPATRAAADPEPQPAPVSATLATAPDRFLTAGEATIRYRAIGRGEPVVLLHFFGGRLEIWNGIADSLASEYRVIALDLRGFGQSSRPSDPGAYGTGMVDDVARLLDHLRIRQAHVVGFSFGAAVAANLARRHPDRVRTLTLAGGVLRDSTGYAEVLAPGIASLERGEGLRGLLAPMFPPSAEAVITTINQQVMATNDRDAMLAALKNPPPAITPRQVASLPVPTLAIVGTADPYLDDTRRLADLQAEGEVRVVIVEGATHTNIVARPDFLRALRAHLAEH